jgi:hypothetical protein
MTRIIPALTLILLCLANGTIRAQEMVSPTYEHLKDLERFVGEWEVKGYITTGDQRDDIKLVANYRWLHQKAFMLATLHDSETKEIIYVGVLGWDPDKQHLMSWDFNFMGTIFNYYQGKNDDGWWVKGTGRMPDHAKVSFRGQFTFIDDNTMRQQGSGTRTKDGSEEATTLDVAYTRIER